MYRIKYLNFAAEKYQRTIRIKLTEMFLSFYCRYSIPLPESSPISIRITPTQEVQWRVVFNNTCKSNVEADVLSVGNI